jgi:hypothetical protein
MPYQGESQRKSEVCTGRNCHRATSSDRWATGHGSGRVRRPGDITDDTSSYNLPGGSAAQVAVYTEHMEPLSLIRRILLRMRSWENYIFLEGH